MGWPVFRLLLWLSLTAGVQTLGWVSCRPGLALQGASGLSGFFLMGVRHNLFLCHEYSWYHSQWPYEVDAVLDVFQGVYGM